LLQTIYVAALLWHLAGSDRSPNAGPTDRGIDAGGMRRWIPAAGLAGLLALAALSDDGVDVTMLLMIVATGWVLLVWWREIRWRTIAHATAVAAIAYFAGRAMVAHGFIGASTVAMLSFIAAPMYVAGALLSHHARIGGVAIESAGYAAGLRSLLWGVVLFVPLGLANAADGSPGADISWVTEWWLPAWLPWFSGIAEEIWFRLLLVSLATILLTPAVRGRRGAASMIAVLFSGLVFGLGHGRDLEHLLVTGLLYGLPFGAVFARRDWEHAVGAHYVVNAIPWLTVYLEMS
jgi:hypothetical protein